MMSSRMVKVIALGVLAAAGAGCSALPAPVGTAGTTRITADFENVAGMYEGNEVDILGLPVGKIEKVTPKGTYVSVEMTFKDSYKVPADAIAALVSPSLVTNRHVELTPPYTGGPTLADGAHLPLNKTRTPVELDRVLRTLDKISTDLVQKPGQPSPSGHIAFNTLNGNGDKIRESITALSNSLKVGLDNRDAVSNAIVRANELTQILADNDQAVRDFSKSTTEVTGLLAEQAPGLTAVLNQLDDFLVNTSTVLGQNKDKLGDALSRLGNTADLLEQNSRQLTETVDVLPLALQNVRNAVNAPDNNLRVHVLLDKSLVDNDQVSLFCERVQMRADGCRTGRLQDFGPDFGLTQAMLGLTK